MKTKKISYIVAGCAIFGLALAAYAMPTSADETKKKPEPKSAPKKTAPPAPEHTAPAAPPAQQHSAPPPPAVQHTAPPAPAVQHNAPPESMQSRPMQQNERQVNRPAQTPAGGQPGRTFGNQPGSQPGRTFGNNPSGRGMEAPHGQPQTRTFTTPRGDVIHRDAGGHVREVHMANGATVYHPMNGPRRVEVVRPGGRVVMASAPGHGFVQREVVIHNTTIIKRTYIYNGVPQARIYRPRVYNGVTLAIYTPVHYYHPSFYVYAYNPWARPVVYSWGWSARPWYGYYGGYFTPYPVYASPSLWLTDYLVAATLEDAYQQRMAARAAAANGYGDGGQSAPMSPEVKQAIADEVHRQIDSERMQGQTANNAGGPDSNIFTDNVPHVFLAGAALTVNSNAGECAIGEGDVVQMNGAPPPGATAADVTVLASRGQDCPKGSTVSVALADLQEMYNQMQATVDRGMGDLQTKQGQGGLPSLPQGAAGTTDSAYAQEAQPDANAASEVASVSQDADRAEQQAVGQAGDGGAPPTLSLGMSVDDVKGIQGDPMKVVDLGSKQIYVYKDLKITFIEGKVSDIQ